MVVNTIANELTLLLYSRGQQKYSGCFILNLRVLIFYFRKGYTTSFPLYGISICSGENVVDIWRQAGYTKVAIFFLIKPKSRCGTVSVLPVFPLPRW